MAKPETMTCLAPLVEFFSNRKNGPLASQPSRMSRWMGSLMRNAVLGIALTADRTGVRSVFLSSRCARLLGARFQQWEGIDKIAASGKRHRLRRNDHRPVNRTHQGLQRRLVFGDPIAGCGCQRDRCFCTLRATLAR